MGYSKGEEKAVADTNEYKHLGPRLGGSRYRQLFVKGTRIRAEIIYGDIVGPEHMTPEEVARDRDLPLEAVLECVDYCERNAELLRQEREEDEADLARRRAENPAMYPLPPAK
jgi:uncharacterized protein (DUF433 family)